MDRDLEQIDYLEGSPLSQRDRGISESRLGSGSSKKKSDGTNHSVLIDVRLKAQNPREERDIERKRKLLETQYNRFVRSTQNFFGEGNELAPGTVRKIVLKNGRSSNWAGIWNNATRVLTLYANTLHTREEFQDTFGHELGHGYAYQEAKKRGYVDSSKSIVAAEAFAEWLRVINNCGGDRIQVNDTISQYLFHSSRHHLHNSISEIPYPDTQKKLQDAAVFNYVYQEYGMDALMKIYGSDANYLNNFKDAYGTFFGSAVAARVPHVVRNMFANLRMQTGEKRLAKLDKKLQEVLGVPSAKELKRQAENWHIDNKYGKLPWSK